MDNLYTFTERLLIENNEQPEIDRILGLLDKVFDKKHGTDYPDRDKDLAFYRDEIIKYAEEVGYNRTSQNQQFAANSAVQYLSNSGNINKFVREQSNAPTQDPVEDPAEDIVPKKWPTYEEFRKKYYKQTVDLGWPKNIAYPDVQKDTSASTGIVYPWNSLTRSSHVFNNRGKGLASFKNYTIKIKDYLYTKFEKNIAGLERLAKKVDSILDVESQFLKKKPLGIASQIGLAIFRGLGATDRDEAMFKWISKKFTGMTIFEYQKMILDEMIAKLSINEKTSENLRNMIVSIHDYCKKKIDGNYIIDQVKTEYNKRVVKAYFDVKSRGQTGVKVYDSFVVVLETLGKALASGAYKSTTGRKAVGNYTEEELKKFIEDIKKLSSQDKPNEKFNGLLENSKDKGVIEFTTEDKDNRGNVTGEYSIEIKYFTKGCRVSVNYSSNMGD